MIYVARHGHVENPGNVLYGNLPGFRLSALGRSQALALGQRLARVRLAAVYSSPLERAVETAAIATARSPAIVPELVDWEPDPDWVGLPWSVIPTRYPQRWAEFRARPWLVGAPAALALRRIAATHPGAGILVVGHQDPLRAALQVLRPVPGSRLRDDPLPQCGLRVVDPSSWKVVERWDPPAASAWPTAGL